MTAIHCYNFKNGWKKMGRKSLACGHNQLFLLPMATENNEPLLVSCYSCGVIWFCDVNGWKLSVTLYEDGLYPGQMCKAEEGYIFIVNHLKGTKPILKVLCTSSELIADTTKIINSRIENINYFDFLPDVKSIVLSFGSDHVVKAIHCETGEDIWELKGEVAGLIWNPRGLLYSPEHSALLVYDTSDDGRLVVINLNDRSHLQTMLLPNLGKLMSMSVCESDIFLFNLTKNANVSVLRN